MSKYVKEVNECLLKIQQGDQAQFEELYKMTANHLRSTAAMYLSNKDFVDDVLSEAYKKVYTYNESFDYEQDGFNWLCKIVENVARNFNAQLENTVSLEQLTFEYIVGDSKSIYETDELAIELKKLNPEEQNVIYLHVYAGYSFMEIAALLNSKKSTVYKQFKAGAKIVLENLKNK